MKKKAHLYHFFLYLVLLIPAGLFSQEGTQSPFDDAIKQFEAFVDEHMALDHVPGLSVGFLKDGHVWVKGFGYMEYTPTLYTMHLLLIVNGGFIFNGVLYGGKKIKRTKVSGVRSQIKPKKGNRDKR